MINNTLERFRTNLFQCEPRQTFETRNHNRARVKCTTRSAYYMYALLHESNLLPLWHVNTRRYKGLLMLQKHAVPKWSAGYSSYFSFAVACDSVLSDHKAVVHLTLHSEFNYTGRRYSRTFVPPLDGPFSILGKWNIVVRIVWLLKLKN